MKKQHIVSSLKYLLLLLIVSAVSLTTIAQCPSVITTTTPTTVAATCPDNGQIIVNSNVSGNGEATYRITSGPTGYPANTFTSNTIPSVKPGTYTVLITCGTATATVTATVGNAYTAPVVNATVSACTSYTTGGVISINGTGSATPLRYAVVLSTDPSVVIPDAAYTTLSGTASYGASAFGTYQVRIKDACNNFTTQTVEVLATGPKANLNINTGNITYTCSATSLQYWLSVYPDGPLVDISSVDYKLEIWESSSTTCPTISGAPTRTIMLTSGERMDVANTIKSFAYRLTSPCGEITEGCKTLPPFVFYATPRVNITCTAGDPVSLSFTTNGTANYTLTYTGYNVDNTVAVPTATKPAQSSFTFDGIPPAHHYSYTFSDACGNTITGSVITPVPGDGATINAQVYELWCTTTLGAGILQLYISGYIPNWRTLVPENITLVPVGGGAPYTAHWYVTETGSMTFFNVVPGSYNLVVNGGTGACTTTIPVTVTGTGLTFSMDGASSQLCGGLGSINATVNTNSGSPVVFRLKDSAGGLVASNSSGLFTNLSAGNYTVEAAIPADCTGITELMQSKTFTIAAAGAGPQVVRKIGVICEPTFTTGKAVLDIAGSGPFKIEMKKSTEPESAFAVIATAAPSTYTQDGLDANITYNFRITDVCGISTSTEITILPLTAINKLTTMSPCVGSAYTLSVDNLPGATYSWTKDGASLGTNLPDIHFSSFATTDNGTYVCTVSFDGCVTRTVTYEISSTFCGSPLSVSFGNVDAFIENDQLVVNWTTEKEENNRLFEIESSTDGENFKKIGTVMSAATGGNSNEIIAYNFKVNAASAAGTIALALLLIPAVRRRKQLMVLIAITAITIIGGACNKNNDKAINAVDDNVYVRIAQVDIDGTKGYSKVVKVVKR